MLAGAVCQWRSRRFLFSTMDYRLAVSHHLCPGDSPGLSLSNLLSLAEMLPVQLHTRQLAPPQKDLRRATCTPKDLSPLNRNNL